MVRYIFILRLILILLAWLHDFPSAVAGQGAASDSKIEMDTSGAPDWHGLRVLDLETAQRIALAENPSLKAAEARIRQAQARVQQAFSEYWPRLDALASSRRVEFSESASRVSARSAGASNFANGTGNPEDFYSAELKFSWLLFDGFEREFTFARERFGEMDSREVREDARRLLLSRVAEGYYSALLARENIAISEADMAFNQRQAKDAKARRRVGTGSLSDVLNFEVQVNSAKTQLLRAKREYEVALYGLATLLGIPEAAFPRSLELAPLEPETPTELAAPAPDVLIPYAHGHRPDLRQLDYFLRQAESEVGIARAQFFPTINLFASVDGERANSARLAQDDFGNSIGLELSYNIFAGGLNRARLGEAKSRQFEADKNLEDERIRVGGEVRRAIAELQLAQEELVLQRKNAVLVRQNRDLVEKEYAAGQASLVRLNEAQRDLTTAQSRLALALVSLRLAWENVEAATARNLIPYADSHSQGGVSE